MKNLKKLLSLFLALVMVIGVLPMAVSAENSADLNEALNVPGGNLVFVSEGEYPWTVEQDWAKSTNERVGLSKSVISTTFTAEEGDVIQFDFQVGGEGSYPYDDFDTLKFRVDGEEVCFWAVYLD